MPSGHERPPRGLGGSIRPTSCRMCPLTRSAGHDRSFLPSKGSLRPFGFPAKTNRNGMRVVSLHPSRQ